VTGERWSPSVGQWVRDVREDRIGIVAGQAGPSCRLRPPHTGPEWDARTEDLEPASPSQGCTHRELYRGGDGATYCCSCDAQIYLARRGAAGAPW
jgi:hypothetical protein